MDCLQRKRIGNTHANRFATSEDFCRVFNENLDSFYLLSLLLTGDHGKAEQCFVAGLVGCVDTNAVFKDWAHSWAKLAIVRNAIAALQPRSVFVSLPSADSTPPGYSGLALKRDVRLYSVLALPDFERFAFVLSVLEQYSEHESAILLGSSFNKVRRARIRAIELTADLDASASKPDVSSVDLPRMKRYMLPNFSLAGRV